MQTQLVQNCGSIDDLNRYTKPRFKFMTSRIPQESKGWQLKIPKADLLIGLDWNLKALTQAQKFCWLGVLGLFSLSHIGNGLNMCYMMHYSKIWASLKVGAKAWKSPVPRVQMCGILRCGLCLVSLRLSLGVESTEL